MTLTIDKKEIFRRLVELLAFVIVILAVYFSLAGFDSKYIFGLIIAFIIGGLPSAYLFLEYLYYTSKLKDVIVNEDKIIVNYAHGGIRQYSFEDISEIRLYKSARMDKAGFSPTLNEKYYDARIVINDGDPIILTSLLGRSLNDAIELISKKTTLDRLKTPYAYINFYK